MRWGAIFLEVNKIPETRRRLSYCVAVLHQTSIAPGTWPPNSPDLNSVDYAIWSIMQQRVYQTTRVHDIDELRQCLITVWCGLEQRAMNDAIDQWQRRLRACVDAESRHFEYNPGL